MARPVSKRAPEFGTRLAAARKDAGLTQMEMAKLLGVSQQMIDYYERRARNPSASFVRKASELLKVSADELLGQNGKRSRSKSGPPSALQKRLMAVQELPPAKQKLVLEFLDSFLRDAQQRGSSNGH